MTLLQTQTEAKVAIQRSYGELPPVYCAGGRVNQVFLNVLKNAATAEASSISIRTFARNGNACVEIKDDGMGISKDRLERIFDFGFQRAGETVKMGFGLATSYNIVDEHGGEIHLDSEVGEGTTVRISLPLGSAE